MHPDPIDFLGLPVRPARREDFIRWLTDPAERADAGERGEPDRPVVVSYLNAANFNLAFESPEFAGALRGSDFLYADGASVVFASRLTGARIPERLSAADYIDDVLERCAGAGLSLGLIGGRPGVTEEFARRARERHPGIDIRLAESGYFDSAEFGSVRKRLDSADPDLVLIGMGSPRQEEIAFRLADPSRPRVHWCVGALFEYSAGRRRAPSWMRHAGLEWIFRLALEPRRLAGRYLIGNPVFVLRVLLRRRVP